MQATQVSMSCLVLMNLTDELLDTGFRLMLALDLRFKDCLYDLIDQKSLVCIILVGLYEQFERGDGAADNVKTHKH